MLTLDRTGPIVNDTMSAEFYIPNNTSFFIKKNLQKIMKYYKKPVILGIILQ
jgi:hypothetical protein